MLLPDMGHANDSASRHISRSRWHLFRSGLQTIPTSRSRSTINPGLGDLVFISIFNHPTDWGSWGIGPGFVAPTATRAELGEQSWKFSPTFAVVNTAIPTWQLGVLGIYNFPA